MTVAEMRAECDARGAPYRLVGEDRICVLDMTVLPGALRAHLRQDGFLRGHAEPQAMERPSGRPARAERER